MLEDTENWLYEEGEDQPKQVYVDKLEELKVSVIPSTINRSIFSRVCLLESINSAVSRDGPECHRRAAAPLRGTSSDFCVWLR